MGLKKKKKTVDQVHEYRIVLNTQKLYLCFILNFKNCIKKSIVLLNDQF